METDGTTHSQEPRTEDEENKNLLSETGISSGAEADDATSRNEIWSIAYLHRIQQVGHALYLI